MKLYDNIKLTAEIAELAQNGIHKGYSGLIVKCEGDIYTVCFYNPYNFGEKAYAKVNKKFLVFSSRSDKRIIQELEGYLQNVKMEKYTKLSECDVQEYDAVELIVEKPKYAIAGVHKGDRGCVNSTYAIDNHWEIIFSERGTGKDIAQIGVAREDFIIIDKF
ncbi:MAG: hypothetical protein IJ329_02100 [Clostridia bacterium]|nr:hypothetical protein [Clostridia bacterium]